MVVSKTSIFYFVSKHVLVGIIPFSVSLRVKGRLHDMLAYPTLF